MTLTEPRTGYDSASVDTTVNVLRDTDEIAGYDSGTIQ